MTEKFKNSTDEQIFYEYQENNDFYSDNSSFLS